MDDLSSDKSLKEDFANDPKKVLKEKYNVSVPDDITIKVHKDTANTLNVVLPHDESDAPVGCW